MRYAGRLVDASPILKLETFAGYDWETLSAAMYGACHTQIFKNRDIPGTPNRTTLGDIAEACAAATAGTWSLAAVLLALFPNATAFEHNIGPMLSVIAQAFADAFREGGSGGGDGASTGSDPGQVAMGRSSRRTSIRP